MQYLPFTTDTLLYKHFEYRIVSRYIVKVLEHGGFAGYYLNIFDIKILLEIINCEQEEGISVPMG